MVPCITSPSSGDGNKGDNVAKYEGDNDDENPPQKYSTVQLISTMVAEIFAPCNANTNNDDDDNDSLGRVWDEYNSNTLLLPDSPSAIIKLMIDVGHSDIDGEVHGDTFEPPHVSTTTVREKNHHHQTTLQRLP